MYKPSAKTPFKISIYKPLGNLYINPLQKPHKKSPTKRHIKIYFLKTPSKSPFKTQDKIP